MFCFISGCKDFATGQFRAVFSIIDFVLESAVFENSIFTTISTILLGLSPMIFLTDDLVLAKSYFIRFEIIPKTVKIQDDSDEATKSVGEKASPFPLLSVGASVIILSLEDIWTDSVLRFPK